MPGGDPRHHPVVLGNGPISVLRCNPPVLSFAAPEPSETSGSIYIAASLDPTGPLPPRRLWGEVAFTKAPWGAWVSARGDGVPLRVEVATRASQIARFRYRRWERVPTRSSGRRRLVELRFVHGWRRVMNQADFFMEYLVQGFTSLAAASARAVERLRGQSDPREWAAPSYEQLLIGYAFAMGADSQRLGAWVRRTSASDTLGLDGQILAAESAWLDGRTDDARRHLTACSHSGLPTLAFGLEIALRLATRLAFGTWQ